jgi:predicted dehydrogenase
MPNELRIGLVGLDTSHSAAFTKCLNDPKNPEHVPGGKVVAAFPGGSRDFELSWSRVAGYEKQLREEYGVTIMDSPEAVAEAVDLLFIISCDGRVHREHFERTIRFKRPTFIDKPFATSSADAEAIVAKAKESGVPVMSCSALRYAQGLVEALGGGGEKGPIVGCDVFGPMAEQPTQPGLFWYGVHMVEMIETVMGPGCKEVRATKNADGEVIACVWNDGRMANIRGLRKGHSQFGMTIHREKGFQFVDCSSAKRSYYAGMLDAIMRSLPRGRSDVPAAQTLEIVRIIEAANRSRQSGQAVQV